MSQNPRQEAEDQDLVRRALVAYWRSADRQRAVGPTYWPAETSSVAEHNGKRYVVLENSNGVLAVYRINNDGSLRRLVRYPRVFDQKE